MNFFNQPTLVFKKTSRSGQSQRNGFQNGGSIEHWKVLSATMVGKQENILNSWSSRLAKTVAFWPWWQRFNSFFLEILFFSFFPFFFFCFFLSFLCFFPAVPPALVAILGSLNWFYLIKIILGKRSIFQRFWDYSRKYFRSSFNDYFQKQYGVFLWILQNL